MDTCPCGLARPLDACCGRFLSGSASPETAEQLMRSRYSAYATGNVDYVLKTQEDEDRQRVIDWSKGSTFVALRVLRTEAGAADDQTGTVEFEADYQSEGVLHTHHELSSFARRDGRWVFLKGHPPTQVRSTPKVGRNDPCPCGSGKKFKKCCG
jgi:SEC-C motif-containing protein